MAVTERWLQDMRVLATVVERYEDAEGGLPFRVDDDLQAQAGLDERTFQQSLRRLVDHGYLDGRTDTNRQVVEIHRVTERGLRETGFWPGQAEVLADQLLVALEEAAEAETEPERKSKLKKASSSLGKMGRDLFVEVSATAITKMTGIG